MVCRLSLALVIGIGVVPCTAADAAMGLPSRPGVTAPAPAPVKVQTPVARVSIVKPAALVQRMETDPARLDFPALWSGETARKTVKLTAPVAGTVSATPPPAPFAIAEMRALGSGGRPMAGIGAGGRSTTTPVKAIDPAATRRTSPPWQVSCAQGDEVQVDVVFAPVFDLFHMTAGAKSAALALRGPSTFGAWNASVPLDGMFNGKRLVPLMTIPDADSTVTVSPTTPTQVHFNIRFVSTGEAFQATVEAYDTSRFSLRGTAWDVSVPSGGTVELPMWMVVNPAHCCSWSPADDQVKAHFHQGTAEGTTSATIRWTIVPDPYTWKNFSGGCKFVTMAGDLTLASSGLVTFDAQQWSIATTPETATFQFTFNGLGKPLWTSDVYGLPLPGQKELYNFHLDVGPVTGAPSPVFFAAARNGPSLTCAN